MNPVSLDNLETRRAKYMGGGRLDTRSHWSATAKMELEMLADAGVDIERAADILGRSPTSIAWRCRTDGLTLPPAWSRLIRPVYKPCPARWTPLAYPYINFRRAENETLLLVNQMVAPTLPGREDVCQDIMLAILERGLTPDRETVNEFIRKFRKANYEGGGYTSSLDAIMPGTDDFRLLDTLADEGRDWA